MTTKFQKGKSGNPAGKPPGAKDKRTELRALLQPHAAELLQKAVKMALEGEPAAMRMCLDRICPTIKATSEPISVPLPISGTLDEQAAAVFKLAANGDIATDDAVQLIAMIGQQCRIKETTELDARIQALEEHIATKGSRL